MKGIVDQAGRAILEIQLRSYSSHPFRTITVWIDTGFTGDLVLPQKTIDELGLNPSGTVDGILADGSQTVLTTYHCEIDWFGRIRNLEVIANSGTTPLLGVGLLLAKELIVDYTNLLLTLRPKQKT
jgi:clan AA aspartic protease